MDTKDTPIYSQSQMNKMALAFLVLTVSSSIFAFCIGYIVGHVDLYRIAEYFK